MDSRFFNPGNLSDASIIPSEIPSISINSNLNEDCSLKQNTMASWMSRVTSKVNGFMDGLHERVRFVYMVSEKLKAKLSLGGRTLHAGEVAERAFKQVFSVEKSERLLKAFCCCLWTTAGPITGILFISSEKIAFHSSRYLKLASHGGWIKFPYKVSVPLMVIKKLSQSGNASAPKEKYIQIVTEDEFEFWFMGFASYARSFKHLNQAISESKAKL